MALRTGILLINLGSPTGTGEAELRTYLREFLSDRRVIDRHGPLWWLVLNAIILRKRPARSALAYQAIWDQTCNQAPLVAITARTAAQLGAAFGSQVTVDWAMRYGARPIGARLAALVAQGCTRILLAPLYPQYAGATTATALDVAYQALADMPVQPTIRTLPPYPAHPTYIAALASAIRQGQNQARADRVLVSFHGLSRQTIAGGDPYQVQCEATYQALTAALATDNIPLTLCYQSRPGRGDWIGPHLEEELERLGQEGARSVAVIAPGFAADCLETLEEIDIRARATFLAAGGEYFHYIPCLNDSAPGLDLLERLIREQAVGWL